MQDHAVGGGGGISVLVRRPNILCSGELFRSSEGVFLHSSRAR